MVNVKAALPSPVVNNHLASKTIWVLALLVCVVPMSSSRVCDERVSVGLSWPDRALGDATGTVAYLRADLEHAVEMQRCGLIGKVIVNGDPNGIALIALDGRNRPLSIDSNHLTREAIGSGLRYVSHATCTV